MMKPPPVDAVCAEFFAWRGAGTVRMFIAHQDQLYDASNPMTAAHAR